MKTELLAIYNGEAFLYSFKPKRDSLLAFKSTWIREIEHAMLVRLDEHTSAPYNIAMLESFAESIGGRLIKVQMTYSLEGMDGAPITPEEAANNEH